MATETLPLYLRRCLPTEVDGFEIVCISGKLSIDGQGHLPHKACGGTGYRYRMLGRECDGYGHSLGGDGMMPPNCGMCETCGQLTRGRIANYTVEALLETGKQQGWAIGVWTYTCQDGTTIWEARVDNCPNRSGLTPEAALKAALLAATEQIPGAEVGDDA